MKNLKQKAVKLIQIISVMLVVATILALATIKLSIWLDNLVPTYIVPSVNVPEPKPLSVKDYVLNEVAKAGLNVAEAECIIKNESNWKNDCNANKNLTTDCGVWRINSVHKNTISFADRLDYKKATAWSIAKRLNDGNWSAWVGHKAGNCQSLAKK